MSQNPKKCSEKLFSEQLVSECQNQLSGESTCHLTLYQYQNMPAEQRNRIQNWVRQWALKARESLPKDYQGIFCLVAAHLLKNAHRYFNMNEPSEFQKYILEQNSISDNTRQKIIENFKETNKSMREVIGLKGKNCISEQQQLVGKLKEEYHTYRNLSFMAGVSVKTAHRWCALPKPKKHKGTELSKLRQSEFERFLLQDTILYSHPSKKYVGKRFLRYTMEETRKMYLEQTDFHTNGVISLSTMKMYHPQHILLCGKTPRDQCLCDKCENFEQLLRSLHAIGMKCIPSNRFAAVENVVCANRNQQNRSNFSFPNMQCILGDCKNCSEKFLHDQIHKNNNEVFSENKRLAWRQWMTKTGKSAPEKCQVKGTIRQAVAQLLDMLCTLKAHLFGASWHRNVFDHIKRNLVPGYVVQIFDFAMNYRNLYQDEIQSAYWEGTQTGIHAVINYFNCLNCSDTVTLILAQITEDLKHDSFVVRAGHDLTFRYLAELGVQMNRVMQFCDNCSSQYKSRRPFAEMARCAVPIIRIYFGEKHGKSHCDGFFGRLKSWVTDKIKARHTVITNAHDIVRKSMKHQM